MIASVVASAAVATVAVIWKIRSAQKRLEQRMGSGVDAETIAAAQRIHQRLSSQRDAG